MAGDKVSAPDIDEIEGRIVAFMQRELLSPDQTVHSDDELLSGEILDSIGVLRLAAFVEEEFAISMQPADFVVENFQTVAVLAAYVLSSSASGNRRPEEIGS
jgi:acyl carrier protein